MAPMAGHDSASFHPPSVGTTNRPGGRKGAPAGGYNKSDNNQVAAAANPAVLSPTARWIQRQPPILAQSHLSILVYLRIGYARLQLPVAILYWMAGGISPQNALDLPTRGVQDNIMAAKSKHSQVPLAMITENSELEQPSCSAP
ncbi:TPA: hypothetical protein ACH3X2_004519 [Trebouxia sp. C0005]